MPTRVLARRRVLQRLSSRHVVLSLGMGVDSVALLVRWITNPSTRNFALADLVVVTAIISSSVSRVRDVVSTHWS